LKPLLRSFGIFIRQIARDNMLWAVCLAPMLTALFFRFAIPYAETLLSAHFQKKTILAGYYLLFDLVLCILPSYMFCYASAMVMLTERDENMAGYMAVTPVGKMGYMMSRLILPAVISVPFSILLTKFFSLTDWNCLLLSEAGLLMSLLSVAVALFIFSFSRNRVEGVAMGKMSGLVLAGLVAPFFVLSDVQYLAAFLPSFWVAKLCMEKNSLFALPALAVSLAWLWMLGRRFGRKLY
jgi:fluoroquinolone transport system permease protein